MILLESEKNQSSERYTCVVISTPGLNNWAKETYEQLHYSNIKLMNKRNLDEDNFETTNLELTKKKEKLLSSNSSEKIDAIRCNTSKQSAFSMEYILNFPVPMDDGKACIVKVINEFLTFTLYNINNF